MGDYIIGECPQCGSFAIEPPSEDVSGKPLKCSGCERMVAPLKPLVRHVFPRGSRIDKNGRVWSPEGEMLYERKKYEDKPEVATLRKLLQAYDEGFMPGSWVSAAIFRDSVDRIIAASKAESGIAAFSSYCGRVPPPPTKHIVEIEIGVGHIIVRKPKA